MVTGIACMLAGLVIIGSVAADQVLRPDVLTSRGYVYGRDMIGMIGIVVALVGLTVVLAR